MPSASQVAGNTFYPTLVRTLGADGTEHLYIQHNGERASLLSGILQRRWKSASAHVVWALRLTPSSIPSSAEEVEHGGVHRWRIDGADDVVIVPVTVDARSQSQL